MLETVKWRVPCVGGQRVRKQKDVSSHTQTQKTRLRPEHEHGERDNRRFDEASKRARINRKRKKVEW